MIKTSVWSAIWCGFVRKKKARVMWKREREVIIVAADMSAIFSVLVLLYSFADREETTGKQVYTGVCEVKVSRELILCWCSRSLGCAGASLAVFQELEKVCTGHQI
jgi:hypothetical protein